MNYMAGTTNPYQVDPQQNAQALISALRGEGAQQPMQQMAGQVQSANPAGGAISPEMAGAMGNGLRDLYNNLSTANTYGTTPFSQQTNMLAAQDAAFR